MFDKPHPSAKADDSGVASGRSKARARYHDLAPMVGNTWASFFTRFRPDEHEFELLHYRDLAASITAELAKIGPGEQPDPQICMDMLRMLDQFGQTRFDEQNQRIDELMDLCEQMRSRLEASELARSHHEDELGHCTAIAQAALEEHDLGPPEGLAHPPLLHNLFNHLLAHLEPSAKRMDTATYRKRSALTPKPEDPPTLFDYDRLRKLFRKG